MKKIIFLSVLALLSLSFVEAKDVQEKKGQLKSTRSKLSKLHKKAKKTAELKDTTVPDPSANPTSEAETAAKKAADAVTNTPTPETPKAPATPEAPKMPEAPKIPDLPKPSNPFKR